ncbi:putative galacturan 1,4-alpha-galacturonidase C [Byssothecium circinans]|uniref:galacturonan 1,4-alpha-galacturonidase n=1 Tax=Byssothecium circinans TaxID=147558 RepID=A0A6A5TJ70_9PLEO|nr:putative galacturan 1,4-alpha-galacturonidase C [Byssothecium circinans]KAF1950856.1 putative galacturan 1,4-alpha-galacturonidase C [Byssothecium circinans]
MLRILRLSLILPFVLASPLVRKGFDRGRTTCTVYAQGDQKDDVPNILHAFSECGNGGRVIFPENQEYWLAQRFNPVVNDVEIDWQGQWTFSDDLAYWRNNSYLIPFQNHRAGFIFSGTGIHIEGHSTSKIHIQGNGDVWYNTEAGDTQVGRPMPFVFWNVSDVSVSNFHIKDPQLWALNIMNGTNMAFNNIKVNATATQAPYGENWVQNTDGFDTMDAKNISLDGLWYQGGDDCIAIKPRSCDITVKNVYCHGGNGIAIGSLGQYLEDSSVENVVVDNVDVVRYNEDMRNCAYIKTWIGVPVPQSNYESAGQPRGGGWGNVTNITLSNFRVQGADAPPTITQDNGNNGSFSGTSKMLVSGISFVNFTGYLNKKSTKGSVSCSNANPCFDIEFENIHLTNGVNGTENVNGTCRYIAPGGVEGLVGSGC